MSEETSGGNEKVTLDEARQIFLAVEKEKQARMERFQIKLDALCKEENVALEAYVQGIGIRVKTL